MKTFYKMLILSLIGFVFSGCLGAMITAAAMPKERNNVKDYKKSIITDKTKSNLFLFINDKKTENSILRTYITINGKVTEPIIYSYYQYYETSPGRYWLESRNQHTLQTYWTCLNIEKSKSYFIDLSKPMSKFSGKDIDMLGFSKNTLEQEYKYARSQVKQKTNQLFSSFAYNGKLKSYTVSISNKNNDLLSLIQSSLENNFKKLNIEYGNDLEIRISTSKENLNLPKEIHYNLYTDSYRTSYNIATLQIIKLEFFIKNKKIDEYIFRGYFNSYLDFTNGISSYIACKYFGKQFPRYK